mgnify:CR=1 FL=1
MEAAQGGQWTTLETTAEDTKQWSTTVYYTLGTTGGTEDRR